jgi:DNA repair exonuclease SbcCD ATPase subunit
LEKLQDELVNHKTPLSEIRQKCREISDKWQTVGELPHDENHNLEEIFWKLHDTLKSAFLTEQKRQYSQLLSELESREDIIARAVIDGTNLEQLQSEWQQIGETAEDIKYLDPLLKQIVQTAESDDKTCLTRLTEQMTKNLKARKKLCREIEELAGIEGENVEPEAVMSLADELAMAISNNFATPSGKSSPPVDKNSKLKSIQKQWISSAPVPAEELSALSSRFSRAWEVASTQCTNS